MRSIELNKALVWLLLIPSAVVATNENASLRRKRLAAEIKADEEVIQTSGKLEDFWEMEAEEAELEASRFLQGMFSMSAPSVSPECPPGRDRTEFFLNIFAEITPRSVLSNPNTPQGQALRYIVEDDALTAGDTCDFALDTIQQRYGLTTLYFSTNGDGWTNNTGWLEGGPECRWAGVTCSRGNNRVIRLELPFNNLAGSIPNEISTLYELEYLNIFANSLTSSLPEGLGNCTKVIFIDAERNLMSGTLIPETLVGLSNLVALRLSRNEFTGTIPTVVGRWSNLQQFWFSNNQVVGTIPTEIGNLQNLRTGFLYSNLLEGTIPSEVGQLTQLTILRLDGNILESTIPEEFYSLTALKDLRLDNNYLDGTISAAIGQLTDLDDLRLSRNTFGGAIPNTIGELTRLSNLILYNNLFEGTLPNVFGDFVQLEQLDVSNNFLTGTIPRSIFTPTVKFVYLSNNTFRGSIPSNFQDPAMLKDLYLDGNQLTGTIPEVIPGRLQNLNEILFHYNLLNGEMPVSFCDLRLDFVLDDLFSDCAGTPPDIDCDFPDCCNRCFMGERPTRRGRT